MIKTLLVKFAAVAIGVLLLIRLLIISEGIPVSILSRPQPKLEKLEQVIQSNPRHAYAHEQIAWLEYNNNNYTVAQQEALKALANNPSDGLAMSVLMMVLNQQRNAELATQAAQLSAHLWPAHDLSIWMIADFWLSNKNIEKAIKAWDIVLRQQPQGETFASSLAATKLFPILNQIAQHEDSSQLFQPYHANPPVWWDAFFQYMVNQADNLAAVERFYQQASLNGHSSKENRQRYLSKLINENQWSKARQIWINSLPDNEQDVAGVLFDGSFETNDVNEEFNWILTDKNNVQVYFDTYSKSDGEHSLRVAFNTWVDDYWGYIRQFIALSPGNYRLSFQTRANLESSAGLKWRIDCYKNEESQNDSLRLAASELLTGRFDWKEVHFDFTVPDQANCKAQKLYLISTGRKDIDDPRIRGDIWFDNFKITETE